MKLPWSKRIRISADSHSLQVVAREAGIEAVRLARALNNPERLLTYITPAEVALLGPTMKRLSANAGLGGKAAVVAIWPHIQAALDLNLERNTKRKATQ